MILLRIYTIISAFLILLVKSYAQDDGNTWILGYYSNGSPKYSVMHLNFNQEPFSLEWKFDQEIRFDGTCATLSNTIGMPLLSTNGMQIFNSHGTFISDTIGYIGKFRSYWDYYYSNTYGPKGYPKHNGALILPVPEGEEDFSIIYHGAEIHPRGNFQVSQLFEARVMLTQDSVLELLYKDSLVGPYHKWYTGTINAIRHANGRDWWIVVFEDTSPKYFSFLLDPSGIKLHHEGSIDVSVEEGLGQATFSGLGNYLARMDAFGNEHQIITLYGSDRCTGDLNRIATIQTTLGAFTGVAFSPNERFLYADDNTHLWQWDLEAPDIATSQTLVDTFDGFVQPGWFEMRFGPLVNGPDGRIYIIPPAGSSEFIHVINNPDLPADQCRFDQHSINLTKPNGRSAPNIPNFRLGPLDGSMCDTLGIDNHPVSLWRYEEEQPGFQHSIRFTDLSYFAPDDWFWDFGNGQISEEPSPIHTFESGIYHVCLTVSNENSSDSLCRWIEILPTGLEDITAKQPDLSIHPNPFINQIRVESQSGTFRNAGISFYDMHGR